MLQFFLLDAEQLSHGRNASMASVPDGAPTVLKHKKKELYKLLLQEFSDLPKAESMDLDNYGVVNVAPSVIPTYLPSFRIFVYNSTGELYDPGRLGDDADVGMDMGMSMSMNADAGTRETPAAVAAGRRRPEGMFGYGPMTVVRR